MRHGLHVCHVPATQIRSKGVRILEHLQHIYCARRVPRGQVLVKVSRATEHRAKIDNAGNVPKANICVERRGVLKQSTHDCHAVRIPELDVCAVLFSRSILVGKPLVDSSLQRLVSKRWRLPFGASACTAFRPPVVCVFAPAAVIEVAQRPPVNRVVVPKRSAAGGAGRFWVKVALHLAPVQVAHAGKAVLFRHVWRQKRRAATVWHLALAL